MCSKKYLLLIPVIAALAVSLSVTVLHGLSIGVDINFHLAIAESWSKGEAGMFCSTVMNENKFPYPPLYHFMLAPGFWLGSPEALASVFQVAFMPLAVASFIFLSYKKLGFNSAFIGGFLLLGSTAFIDRCIQPQPQAVDFILLPMVFYWFLNRNSRNYIVGSVLMVWNHGIVSLAALSGTFITDIKKHRYKKLLFILVGSSFILAVSAIYIFSGLQNYGSRTDTYQEFLFWTDPFFLPVYMGAVFAGFFVLIYRVYYRRVSELTKLCLLTVAGLAVMIPVWPDRWVQYSTIPLSLVLLEYLQEKPVLFRNLAYSAVIFVFIIMVDLMFFI